jgi:glutathione S-transferase
MNLELDFPNVPYLLDGNTTITETTAIQKYIIKRWGKL